MSGPRIIKRTGDAARWSSEPPFEEDFCSSIPRVIRGGTHAVPAPLDDMLPAPPRVIRGAQCNSDFFALPIQEWAADFPYPEAPAPPADPVQIAQDAWRAAERAAIEQEINQRWEARLNDELEAARAEAYETGYAEGRAAGEMATRTENEQAMALCQADVARLRTLWDDHIHTSQPLLAELAILVAEAVLDSPLGKTAHEATARAIARAVEDLSGDGALTLTLPPDDYLRLQETGLADQLSMSNPGLRWNPDADLPSGDWYVESPLAVVRRQRAELIESFIDYLGLGAANQSTFSFPIPDTL